MAKTNYDISSRKVRALTQNISLLATLNENNGTKMYIVKGTIGTTYKVIIDETPSCTCYDFTTRHSTCKHIYFVLLRILNVDPDTYIINSTKVNTNVTMTNSLIFENALDNTFKFIEIYDKNNVMTNIANYIEQNYGIEAKHNTQVFNDIPEAELKLNERHFAGVYIIKVNDKLFELYMRSITKINKGWFFNNYVEKVTNEKVGRFILVDKQ